MKELHVLSWVIIAAGVAPATVVVAVALAQGQPTVAGVFLSIFVGGCLAGKEWSYRAKTLYPMQQVDDALKLCERYRKERDEAYAIVDEFHRRTGGGAS